MRLRTLPQSLSGVLLGILLAFADFQVNPYAALLICLTAVLLQIISNLANELGDVLNNTDRADRNGPAYGLNSGQMSVKGMKTELWLMTVLTCLSGLAMIYVSFGTLVSLEAILLIMLGASAVYAAFRYTLGPSPYGYRGLGDFYVFIFFGLVSTLGAYFVAAHTIPNYFLPLPAAAIGFFSVAVLNINNIRDASSDSATRITVAIKLGEKGSRIYQTVLIVLGWACALAYCLLRFFDPLHYAFLVTLPLFAVNLRSVWTKSGRELDKALPFMVLSTFLFALIYGLGFVAYLWRQ